MGNCDAPSHAADTGGGGQERASKPDGARRYGKGARVGSSGKDVPASVPKNPHANGASGANSPVSDRDEDRPRVPAETGRKYGGAFKNCAEKFGGTGTQETKAAKLKERTQRAEKRTRSSGGGANHNHEAGESDPDDENDFQNDDKKKSKRSSAGPDLDLTDDNAASKSQGSRRRERGGG